MKHKRLFSIFILTLLFTILFHKQEVGLNLLIYESALLAVLFFRYRFPAGITISGMVLLSGLLITCIAVVVHASAFAITMNIISLFIFAGWMLFPEGRSLLTWMGLAAGNFMQAPAGALQTTNATVGSWGRPGRWIRQAVYFILPVVLVLFFLMIYQQSNPIFFEGMKSILRVAVDWIDTLMRHLDFTLIGTFLFGLLVSVFYIFRRASGFLVHWEQAAKDKMFRSRKGTSSMPSLNLGLKTEYHSAIFLLVMLNLLIAVQNILDIRWIWFGFTWNGQYLMEFVHDGTYLLIFSLLASVVVMLWIYRRNLNFYPENRLLKRLSHAWLLQNMILSLSVGIRIYWYIQYFALAYKRIGVILFLVTVFIGLVTVMIKISRKRSFFWLVRSNALSVFAVLLIGSLFNWDNIIARYNFSHYKYSFVHLDWLSTLSDKALPDLDQTPEFLVSIKQCQDKTFRFEQQYMAPEVYHQVIRDRKKEFLEKMSHRSILSWNLAEAMAKRKLTDNR